MITTHKELVVWQMSMDLAVDVYYITKNFPKSEEFGLTSQMRRAVVSIPSNIAEGYGRGSRNELRHFLEVSSGSASELETQLLICKRVGLENSDVVDELCDRLKRILKMLSSLISRCKEGVDYKQK
ncbi:four helix bundle protein [Prevotellamassilia timonensis]|uniref:four helix bundle protein n=1 Tax=Prevotellamassilia timonensis TaxID=1852370 RepID=UPI0030796D50